MCVCVQAHVWKGSDQRHFHSALPCFHPNQHPYFIASNGLHTHAQIHTAIFDITVVLGTWCLQLHMILLQRLIVQICSYTWKGTHTQTYRHTQRPFQLLLHFAFSITRTMTQFTRNSAAQALIPVWSQCSTHRWKWSVLIIQKKEWWKLKCLNIFDRSGPNAAASCLPQMT